MCVSDSIEKSRKNPGEKIPEKIFSIRNSFMKTYLPFVILYGLLGALLSVSGVDAINNPLSFIGIILCVMCIDVLSFKEGLSV